MFGGAFGDQIIAKACSEVSQLGVLLRNESVCTALGLSVLTMRHMEQVRRHSCVTWSLSAAPIAMATALVLTSRTPVLHCRTSV
jgi:hypothetical protein